MELYSTTAVEKSSRPFVEREYERSRPWQANRTINPGFKMAAKGEGNVVRVVSVAYAITSQLLIGPLPPIIHTCAPSLCLLRAPYIKIYPQFPDMFSGSRRSCIAKQTKQAVSLLL